MGIIERSKSDHFTAVLNPLSFCSHGLEQNPNSSLSPSGPYTTYLDPIRIWYTLPFALHFGHTDLGSWDRPILFLPQGFGSCCSFYSTLLINFPVAVKTWTVKTFSDHPRVTSLPFTLTPVTLFCYLAIFVMWNNLAHLLIWIPFYNLFFPSKNKLYESRDLIYGDLR